MDRSRVGRCEMGGGLGKLRAEMWADRSVIEQEDEMDAFVE
jgi:hypothetical protein